MSAEDVAAVLLADGWHDVANRSFALYYPYGFDLEGRTVPPLGDVYAFLFKGEDGHLYFGPLSSVLSVTLFQVRE